MYDLFKFIMVAGSLMAIAAFAAPALGVGLEPRVLQLLTWGGLACVAVGFIGRQVTRPSE